MEENTTQFNVNNNLSTNKLKRKLERKLNRYEKMFSGENFVISKTPTKCIVVCNAGLVNGIGQEVIIELFSAYGPLKNIYMIEGKSYCFVEFQILEHAENAYDIIQGHITLPQTNGTLYLLYCEKAPDTNTDWKKVPPGLILIPDFISEDEEQSFTKYMSPVSDNALKHRQVKHYGYEFRYGTNDVDPSSPLEERVPEEFNIILDKLKDKGYLDKEMSYPDQLTINQYLPGQGIPPHVDTHSPFGEIILSLSLLSDVIMEFRDQNENHLSVLLPRRSLLMLTEESRYGWTHGITPRKLDVVQTENGVTIRKREVRLSCTFRWVNKIRDCHCKFEQMCDMGVKMTEDDPSLMEKKHVHEVYDAIADHFSDTRHSPWRKVSSFLESLNLGSVLIDVGCGNGKYFSAESQCYQIGCDRNSKLALICQSRGFETLSCDCLYLPFRNSCADAVISIAVIHHLSTIERRYKAIEEIIRILRNNGQALLYVWAKDQTKEKKKSNYLRQGNKHKEFNNTDVFVPYHNAHSSETHLRYYHVFEDNEMLELCKQFNNIHVENYYYDDGNWCVQFRKLS